MVGSGQAGKEGGGEKEEGEGLDYDANVRIEERDVYEVLYRYLPPVDNARMHIQQAHIRSSHEQLAHAPAGPETTDVYEVLCRYFLGPLATRGPSKDLVSLTTVP